MVSISDARLRWNYGTDGVADDAQVTLQVIATEMVYVPTGTFSTGSGGTGTDEFILTTINTGSATVAGGYPTGETAPGRPPAARCRLPPPHRPVVAAE